VTGRLDRLVIEAVVGLAQGLGKKTIAEFVTNAATKQMVRSLDVDYAQGYHIGKPLPISQIFSVVPSS
jgi:EAL domain-containing protein (putative c-di-GMP-specific phosphodiesterase class I)